MICFNCDKYGHTKWKCFKLISYPTNWGYNRTCFTCNETGHISRDCPKDDENRKVYEREINADINGIFIITVIYEPCDEERA